MNVIDEIVAVVAVGIAVVIVTSLFVKFRRLHQWATNEGVRIIDKELRRSGDFYVTIEDNEKNRFNGWVKAGGIVAALTSRKVEVVWDNRPNYLK